MPKVKKIYTKILYVSVTPTSDKWARKQGARRGWSNSRYIDELIKKDQRASTGFKSTKLNNFGV